MGRINTHLAHDMRTPLQLIYSCAQMIEAELADSAQPAGRYARLLMENVQSLRNMITSDLDAATGSADIVEITRSLCRRMDVEAARAGIVLLFSCNTAVFRMRVDQVRYERILQNLVSNALRFTPDGGNIRVDLRAMGETVEISVSDSGPGIDESRADLLFSDGETQGGYGLGLGIARRLARQMDGRLELAQHREKGACFILRLPMKSSSN